MYKTLLFACTGLSHQKMNFLNSEWMRERRTELTFMTLTGLKLKGMNDTI